MLRADLLAAGLALATLASGGACSKDKESASGLEHGLRLVYEVEGDEHAAKHTLEVVRRRLEALGGPSNVYRKDGLLFVELGGDDDHERARRLIATSSQLELVLAVRESSYVRELVAAVDGDERARRAGVEIAREVVSTMEGTHEDVYLRGPTRVVLESFVSELTARTSTPMPSGHRFLFERVAAQAPDEEAYWRAHFARAGAVLDGTSIADARADDDPATGRPHVLLTLDDESAARFEEVTRQHVGDRLLVVVNGVVTMAPVVQGAIPGGKVQVTLGGGLDHSLDRQRREAQDTALLFRAGSLRSPLRLIGEETF